ncbi:MAG: hypothetical protein HXS44_15140 [Theionarchaea archaeon]|nr:hypothetical protein [Theionarchaea archaeon]
MKGVLILSVIMLVSFFYVPESTENGELTPENTVILSNETDASFLRDFSVILKRLRSEWIILESAEVPESVRDRNLIIIGELDAVYTGALIREFLTQEEIDYIEDGHYSIGERESPYTDGKFVYICAGSDRIKTKKAAEERLISLDGEWTTPFPSVSREEALEFIAQIQYIPEDDEMPIEELIMLDQKPKHVSSEEAVKDTEYLFSLLSHGYCGYGYFMTKGDFDEAKKSLLREIETQSMWSPEDFSQVIHEHLTLIHDCHFQVGAYQYCSHEDFWYDTTLEFSKTMGEYFSTSDNYKVVSINGKDPQEFMVPSLNTEGDPVYRLGMLSFTPPAPLTIEVQREYEQQFTIQLYRSDFTYFSEDIFQEDIIGGIPVVRIRSLTDANVYAESIDKFFEAAHTYRGEPCLIIDIRGNEGGNALWAKRWVTRFTGQEPSDMYYYTELISKTTAMGRVNLMEYLLNLFPDTQIYETEMDRFKAYADLFEKKSMMPHWTGPLYSDARVIPNDTTIIVVMNGKTGSAAELFITYLSQVKNVIFVGENSAGCLTFGLANYYQLPHSNLLVQIPMGFSIPVDLEFTEEKGFFPDLWVPGKDALNYAVAAVRNGTITTAKPIEDILQEEFTPEELERTWIGELFLPVLSLTVLGIICAIANRKRDKTLFFILGLSLAAIGIIIVFLLSPLGYLFSILGMMYITIGVYKWRKSVHS